MCVCVWVVGGEYVCVHAQISHYRQNKLPAGTVSLACVCLDAGRQHNEAL